MALGGLVSLTTGVDDPPDGTLIVGNEIGRLNSKPALSPNGLAIIRASDAPAAPNKTPAVNTPSASTSCCAASFFCASRAAICS